VCVCVCVHISSSSLHISIYLSLSLCVCSRSLLTIYTEQRQTVRDLDALIAAHNRYVDGILNQALLTQVYLNPAP